MANSPLARSKKGTRNVLLGHYGADSPQFKAADLDYRRISVEERIAELLAEAPPFTPEQLERLRPLLSGTNLPGAA